MEGHRQVNPIIEEVVKALFEDLHGEKSLDEVEDEFREMGTSNNREILEASELVASLGGVDLVKELAEELAQSPLTFMIMTGDVVTAVKAGTAAAICAGAMLARRADAANTELPSVE